MNKTIKLMATFMLLFILTACAGMQNPDMASIENDMESKKFRVAPRKSKIYIVRPSKFGGAGAYIYPTINNMVTGSLASGSYLMLDVLPGKHVISAAGNLEKPEGVEIIAEAGKLYFVKMFPKVKIGLIIALSPGLHNEIVNSEEGQKLVLQNKRYKTIEYEPLAQDLTSDADKAKIYIIRPKTFRGSASNHKLSPTVDNIVVGALERGSYLVIKVSHGLHSISAAGKYEGKHVLELEASKTKNYFMKITPKMGFAFPKLKLEMISQEEGNRILKDYKQIKGQ